MRPVGGGISAAPGRRRPWRAARIVAGTVILFDECFNIVGWRAHEFKAFQEFAAERRVRYRHLCRGYQQAAVIVESVGG